jgi:hypothetical protein
MEAGEEATVAAVEQVMLRLPDDWRATLRKPSTWLRHRVTEWLEEDY